MGNPYETERLVRNFSVWNVLLKQLVEEAMLLRGLGAGPADDSGEQLEAVKQIVRSCVLKANPNFPRERWGEMDELVAAFEGGAGGAFAALPNRSSSSSCCSSSG